MARLIGDTAQRLLGPLALAMSVAGALGLLYAIEATAQSRPATDAADVIGSGPAPRSPQSAPPAPKADEAVKPPNIGEAKPAEEKTPESRAVEAKPDDLKPVAPPASDAKPPETKPNEPKRVETAPPAAPPAPAAEAAPAEPIKVPAPRLVERPQRGEIVVAAGSGAYLAAQRKAIIGPFTERTDIRVKVEAPLPSAEIVARSGRWDVAEVAAGAAEEACKTGTLETISPDGLARAADGGAAGDDFLAGFLGPCHAGSIAWSSLVVFDKRQFVQTAAPPQRPQRGKGQAARAQPLVPPAKLKDVFDPARFPGQRALPKGPRYLLEMALMADEVPVPEVYGLLAGEEGAKRAFAKLEALRGHIVWLDKPGQATELLSERKAAIAVAFNGRAFQDMAVNVQPFGAIWDGQIYHVNAWVVRKGTPNRQAALDFVAFATAPERLAAQAQFFPYGPGRRSAIAGARRHEALRIDIAPFLPTAPQNLATALRYDEAFWAKHGKRLEDTFAAWLKGPEAAAETPPAEPAAKPAGEAERSG